MISTFTLLRANSLVPTHAHFSLRTYSILHAHPHAYSLSHSLHQLPPSNTRPLPHALIIAHSFNSNSSCYVPAAPMPPVRTPPPFLYGPTRQRATSSLDIVLRCVVEGESTTFKVAVSTDDDVEDLKKLVREEGIGGAQHAILAKNLRLFKVSTPLQWCEVVAYSTIPIG